MPKIIRILRGKDGIKTEIIGMLEDIIEVAETNTVARELITPHVTLILESLPYSNERFDTRSI